MEILVASSPTDPRCLMITSAEFPNSEQFRPEEPAQSFRLLF